MRSEYRLWSAWPYQEEQSPPVGVPQAGFWPMFFIKRDSENRFFDPFGREIQWQIKPPLTIDWNAELALVERTVNSVTPQQIQSASYWATGEIGERFSTMLYEYAAKYPMGSPNCARMQGFFHATLNDVFVVCWYLKYMWDVARPNQYGRHIPKIIDTPRFPAYPSAHASLAGAADILMTYFFPEEEANIKATTEASAQSRLYAGVHFDADNKEGLRLGRQIGKIAVEILQVQNVKQ
ncbi:PAP2 superfamily protein [Bacillus sp. THAF10]|uniref:phosphatase PAP2 family protein n=1 Tax=Bacillus sp. THAF10 TaxID=2587848 RepID=UPI0012685C00|nr:phosphatase PAP2 family protein [Bacillus sp. THAF10]QFT89512.1 PAP2 superfamily protein [Bacillus sp. THAF10]